MHCLKGFVQLMKGGTSEPLQLEHEKHHIGRVLLCRECNTSIHSYMQGHHFSGVHTLSVSHHDVDDKHKQIWVPQSWADRGGVYRECKNRWLPFEVFMFDFSYRSKDPLSGRQELQPYTLAAGLTSMLNLLCYEF